MHKYGIKGREIVAKTLNGTMKISTFGWLYQLGTWSWEENGEIERREDAVVDLFNKRAVDYTDPETGHTRKVLPYVIESHISKCTPLDKSQVFPVRANCPHRFFVEGWSEARGGEESFGKLVGYILHNGTRWVFKTSYTKKIKVYCDVPVADSHYQGTELQEVDAVFGLHYVDATTTVQKATYHLRGLDMTFERFGRDARDYYDLNLDHEEFESLPQHVKDDLRLRALEIIEDRKEREEQRTKELLEIKRKQRLAAQQRELEQLEQAQREAEQAAAEAAQKVEAARRNLSRPELPPLPKVLA